ncbi:YdcF family protein [Acidicapsa acidisoli]|uniref:YdcF family protein n=1 Tax=Acidicapsa acidisoli TaxID=1615681 RepID=UPI0021DF43FC|nr:YdcF family protein [Acidicapsa acidisoli]
MSIPVDGPDRPADSRGNWIASAARFLLIYFVAVFFLSALGWGIWVYVQIERYAYEDHAAPADVICVFGAAEYAGRPSPVLRARLDHALALYEHGIAPVVLTLGGSAPGDAFSEGQVGQAYLMANGVPEKAIIAETQSRSTEEQARRIVAIARANGYRRVVIVSDPAHLFRIREICASEGLQVLTSPRQQVAAVGSASEWQQMGHEILAYTLWRMHLH